MLTHTTSPASCFSHILCSHLPALAVISHASSNGASPGSDSPAGMEILPSPQNPLSSPPTSRATTNRKEGWPQTSLQHCLRWDRAWLSLENKYIFCQVSIVCILCAREKPSGSLRLRSFEGKDLRTYLHQGGMIIES